MEISGELCRAGSAASCLAYSRRFCPANAFRLFGAVGSLAVPLAGTAVLALSSPWPPQSNLWSQARCNCFTRDESHLKALPWLVPTACRFLQRRGGDRCRRGRMGASWKVGTWTDAIPNCGDIRRAQPRDSSRSAIIAHLGLSRRRRAGSLGWLSAAIDVHGRHSVPVGTPAVGAARFMH